MIPELEKAGVIVVYILNIAVPWQPFVLSSGFWNAFALASVSSPHAAAILVALKHSGSSALLQELELAQMLLHHLTLMAWGHPQKQPPVAGGSRLTGRAKAKVGLPRIL